MARVEKLTIGLGYRLPNVPYGHQENSMFLTLTDFQEGEDVGALAREVHRVLFEHLFSTINHGAVQQAAVHMFKTAQLRDSDYERPLILDLTVGLPETHDLEYVDDAGTVQVVNNDSNSDIPF